MAVVFARETSATLTSLVKKLNAATEKNSNVKMGSFVVFCSDDEKLEPQLKDLAEKEKLTKTILTIDNPSGPSGYEIAKEADITVVLYVSRTVKANHTFRKGELKDKDIEKILGDLPKILEKDSK